MPGKFASYSGRSNDWSWIAPKYAGARWDPVGERDGHDGSTITLHYDASGASGRVTDGMIRRAATTIAAATQFRYREIGTARHADVQIRWRSLDRRQTVGLGGVSKWIWGDPTDGHLTITRGDITLNTRAPRTFHAWRSALMHEWGHVMGLGHAKEPSQVLYPTGYGQTRLGTGDVNGLHHVSALNGEVGATP